MQRLGRWPRLQGLVIGYVGVSAYLTAEFSSLSHMEFTVTRGIPIKRAIPFILGDTAAFLPVAAMWPQSIPRAMRGIYAEVQVQPEERARRQYWTVYFVGGGSVAKEFGRVELIRAGFIEGSCEYFEALEDFCWEVERVGLDKAKLPALREGGLYP